MRPCRLGDIALLAPVGTQLWRFEDCRASAPMRQFSGLKNGGFLAHRNHRGVETSQNRSPEIIVLAVNGGDKMCQKAAR
jgi:hypothetical protein